MSEKILISKLAKRILQDPILLHKLSEKVCEIMKEDLRNNQDRNQSYGR
jgi:hypothetical protein